MWGEAAKVETFAGDAVAVDAADCPFHFRSRCDESVIYLKSLITGPKKYEGAA
jgi:hypothetical protein